MLNRRNIIKVIIAAIVISAAIIYLFAEATDSSWTYYYSVDEFARSKAGKQAESGDSDSRMNYNQIIRLAGRVKDGTIVTDADKMQLEFELAGENSSVAVSYHGMVPKNFEAGKEVVVEGKIGSDSVFKADKILTRCESKYKVKLDKKIQSR